MWPGGDGQRAPTLWPRSRADRPRIGHEYTNRSRLGIRNGVGVDGLAPPGRTEYASGLPHIRVFVPYSWLVGAGWLAGRKRLLRWGRQTRAECFHLGQFLRQAQAPTPLQRFLRVAHSRDWPAALLFQ